MEVPFRPAEVPSSIILELLVNSNAQLFRAQERKSGFVKAIKLLLKAHNDSHKANGQ